MGKREEPLLGAERKASNLQRDSSPSVADSRDYMHVYTLISQSYMQIADDKFYGLYLTYYVTNGKHVGGVKQRACVTQDLERVIECVI